MCVLSIKVPKEIWKFIVCTSHINISKSVRQVGREVCKTYMKYNIVSSYRISVPFSVFGIVRVKRDYKNVGPLTVLYSITTRKQIYTEHNQLIMTTSITNEYTSLYKYLTLFFRKGHVCWVWEISGDRDGLLYWPKFFLDQGSSFFACWLGLFNRGSLRTQSSLSGAVSHFGTPVSNCLKPFGRLVILFSNVYLLPAVLPVIYTSASLDWRLGWGSIYNNWTL